MPHPALASGRTAVITGAASGVGLAAAEAMASLGMMVAMLDLPGRRLETAAARLADSGARVLPLGVDVSDEAALQEMAERIARELPPVRLLMNNAGMSMPSSALADRDAWARTLAVNFWGVINGTQAFAPQMFAHGETGLIVNTGSKQGITSPPGNPAYNVSKAGVKTYTEALAHELRSRPDCRVSAHLLIPGWVHTGITAAEGAPRPPGAWTAAQTVAFMLESLERGDFYILCPDNEVTRRLDEKRIAWAAGDIIENRPALSRWHPDYADEFKAFVGSG